MRVRFGVIMVLAAAALSVVAFVVQQWTLTRYGLVLDLPEWLWTQLAVGWAFLISGLAADRRRTDSLTGRWMVVFAMVWISRLVFTPPAMQWEAVGWGFALYGLLFVILYTLPSGRLWGWEKWGAGIWMAFVLVMAVAVVAFTDFYGEIDDPVCCPTHLLLIEDAPATADAIGTVGLVVAPVVFIAIVVVQFSRWLRASQVGRRNLNSVIIVLVPLVVLLVLVPVVTVITGGFSGLTEAFGSSLGIAPAPQPSRLNLYVQDGALIVLPVLILAGLLSTRLSRARVADMMEDLASASNPQELEERLQETLADPGVRLVFLREGSEDVVDVSGKKLEFNPDAQTMTGLDERVSILHDPAVDSELVAAAGAAAGLAINNARLQAELRAQLLEVQESRRRLVTATDEARRGVERDLHDGAQQRLIVLSATLKEAASQRSEHDPVVDELLADAAREADLAIGELRELARGVHPAILTQAGLGPAISNLADRAPIPVHVEVDPGRYPLEVEATAYFVVAETLSNVFKHSGANSAEVSVRAEGGGLHVEVTDAGSGSADPDGSGLRGLSDRVSSQGGRFRVEQASGGGTKVTAWLPLRGEVN
ncbi:MAG TPA: ATP-binding protein [Acidimicrobiia bacterium]|nr:ATP-binding protein [Acidimicrobiia bacterium]